MRRSKSSPPRNVLPAVDEHLDDTVTDISRIEMSNVPPPEVVDQRSSRLRGGSTHPVGERSGRRLVDDAQHFQAGDLAGSPSYTAAECR